MTGSKSLNSSGDTRPLANSAPLFQIFALSYAMFLFFFYLDLMTFKWCYLIVIRPTMFENFSLDFEGLSETFSRFRSWSGYGAK